MSQFDLISRYSDLAGTQLVVESDYAYDGLDRLERLEHNNASATVAFYDFSYDGANRIAQIADIDGITDYTYDKTNQLLGSDRSNDSLPDENYAYDANGNRESSYLHDSDYVTGVNNRLESDGIYTYEYDREGNLVRQTAIASGDIREFEWDYRDRLVAVVDSDAQGNETQRVEFQYDAMNRRLAKNVDGVTTYFIYDRDDVLLEFVEEERAATLANRYLHGPQVDQMLAQEGGDGEVLWHLSDHLGTIRDLADSNGQVLNHITYDSYGNAIAETDSSVNTRYLFTGREWDEETELHYYRNRYFNAQIGRFISEDLIGFEAGDANLYRYVGNNPVMAIDPTGLITFLVPGGFGDLGFLEPLVNSLAKYPVVPMYGVRGNGSRNLAIEILTSSLAIHIFQEDEPIIFIAHSDGNRLLRDLIDTARGVNAFAVILDNGSQACKLSEFVEIQVARLDPILLPNKPIGANKVIDIGSNNPLSLDPRDITALRQGVDFRADIGTSHNGLLSDFESVKILDRAGFNF